MGWRGVLACAVVCAAAAGRPAEAGGGERPFVGDKSGALKGGGTVYVVEGRIRIPRGIDIAVMKDTKLVGRGEGGGVIELEGQLVVCGVSESRVVIEGVTIEVQPKFALLRLDMVNMSGGKGIVSPPDKPVDGRIFVMNTMMNKGATLDVTMSANEVDLQGTYCEDVVRVRAVDPEGSTVNKVKLNVMNCSGQGAHLYAGLEVERVSDVTVRTNDLQGEKVSFVNCNAVTFDANYVTCKSLEFIQAATGRFAKSQIQKCDFQGVKIVLTAPVVAGKAETIKVDKCWFDGEMNEKVIREKYFQDHDDNPESGVTADIVKVMEKPLQLAGSVKR